MAQLPQQLTDNPAFLSEKFNGYKHLIDPTVQPFDTLTFPSRNCSIPIGDKIIPDKGKTLLGQAFTENVSIIGNKEKFKNMGGLEMEARVWQSSSINLLDVIEIYYTNDKLMFTNLIGVFQVGETIIGQTSGATAIISNILNSVLTLTNITGVFQVGEQILGTSSGATADVVTSPISIWHQITESTNPLPRGLHEYYFDEWFDTNVDPSLTKRLPRLIWVNGYETNTNPKTGLIFSWTGGIALITAVTGTDLLIDPSLTWRSLGFTEDASANAYVIVNGVSYQLANPADLDTNSVNVTNTAGVSVGDIATSKIESDVSPIPFDVCRQNKGYMFYGNWTSRELYQSNAFNRPATQVLTSFSGSGLNDVVLSGTYTGTVQSVYQVKISKSVPLTNDNLQYPGLVEYLGNGGNFLLFDFSAYSDPNDINVYDIYITQPLGVGNNDMGYTAYKNGTFATTNGIQIAGVAIVGPFPIADGITWNASPGYYQGYNTVATPTILQPGDHYRITYGIADSFDVIKDGETISSNTQITGGAQLIDLGISITFANLVGHSQGDTFTITAYPLVDRAWREFYYNLPIRKPGEGYKYRLPSNFWTMDTQEESMYINGSYGEWGFVSTVLSADLQSEDVSYTPLKQVGASKVLYPYLTGHINDDLIFISVSKNLDTLGRKIYMEKPQTTYWSEDVKLDFEASSFAGGRIKYVDKKVYISSPENGIMHCYDTHQEYWQPPKTFPEVGILSVFGNDLICHSNVRNQSYSLFTNTSGDNGFNYDVVIRTPYTSLGDKWSIKNSSMSFIEGYIEGAPPLLHTAYLGVNGCSKILEHPVSPILCITPSRAPLGDGFIGSHPLGSDLSITGNYFQEIFKGYSPVLEWYLLGIEISCSTKTHSYAILSLGMNAIWSNKGNNTLVNPSNKVI